MKKYTDIGKEFNVSEATINNWIKTGVIPVYSSEQGYDEQTYDDIVKNIRLGGLKLQKRANRLQNNNCSTFSSLELSEQSKLIIAKLRKMFFGSEYSINEFLFVIGLICLEKRSLIKVKNDKSKIAISSEYHKFTAFLNQWKSEFLQSPVHIYRKLLTFDFPDNEIDFLGAVYESLRTVSDKSASGAYFTPSFLCNDVDVPISASVLDPCAGTGTMLLNILSDDHNPQKIFLQDIDETALRIAKINFVLKFNSCKSMVNTKIVDIFVPIEKISVRFDFIISNPPYGAKPHNHRKSDLIAWFPKLATSESFSIAVLQSFNLLKTTGKLIFILPESILYVGGHSNIRKEIFSNKRKITISHFGKAFNGVMSSIIRLEAEPGNGDVLVYKSGSAIKFRHNQLLKNLNRPPFVFSMDELNILNSILTCKSFTLKDKCSFGLGIVTGNNSKHLVPYNSKLIDFLEPIFTGRELFRANFAKPRFMIDYKPEILQQVASISNYRSAKICYRFISGSVITAYDDTGRLILNSINFFILKDPTISPKAISAYFNSNIVSFIYRTFYNSSKLLRSHIESFPIPVNFYKYEEKLEDLYDLAASGGDVSVSLNKICNNMFGLSTLDVENIGEIK